MTEIKEKIRGKKEEEKNSKENNKKIINLIVISGPSGVGKTTIIKKILQDPELKDKLTSFNHSHKLLL